MKYLLAVSTALCLVAPAQAEVRLSGTFTAARDCPATPSIHRPDNPGDVEVKTGKAYPLLAKNKDDATHYLVEIDGAQPRERWVEIGCGATSEGAPASTPASAEPASGEATHVLALGWEPAFCLGHDDKAECQRESADSFEATHLSLHGLWPQPIGKAFCGVEASLKAADRDHDWSALPEPDLSPKTRVRLAAAMPGVQSGLERHEWLRHGTCFGATPDVYFNRAAGLAEAVNASAVRALFAGRVGRTVTAQDIRAAFDQAFGAGAGSRVEVHCQGRAGERLISELIVSLAGAVNGEAPLADLIRAAPPVAPGCPGGRIAQAR